MYQPAEWVRLTKGEQGALDELARDREQLVPGFLGYNRAVMRHRRRSKFTMSQAFPGGEA